MFNIAAKIAKKFEYFTGLIISSGYTFTFHITELFFCILHKIVNLHLSDSELVKSIVLILFYRCGCFCYLSDFQSEKNKFSYFSFIQDIKSINTNADLKFDGLITITSLLVQKVRLIQVWQTASVLWLMRPE